MDINKVTKFHCDNVVGTLNLVYKIKFNIFDNKNLGVKRKKILKFLRVYRKIKR